MLEKRIADEVKDDIGKRRRKKKLDQGVWGERRGWKTYISIILFI